MGRCASCGAEHADGAKFCSECGRRLERARPEQRKLATMLFCDVVGSTAMGELLDAESGREVMLRFFTAMRGVIEAHGGTTQKFIGDAVMAVFGVPVAREDDALRAVTAAVEMQGQLRNLNAELEATYGVRLQIRTGINSGTVVAGEAIHDEALVLGDAVNMAARIEQAAGPGQILIGESTLRLVRDRVVTEPLPPVTAKGKSEPLVVHALTEVRGERQRARLDAVEIVDREAPLGQLSATLAAVERDRGPRLLCLVGEAGIGKTRLVNELESRGGATFLHGRCLPYGEGITYWPLGEIVREGAGIPQEDTAIEALGRLAERLTGTSDAARIVGYLGQALGLRGGEAVPEEIAWAARRFLEELAREGPVVVCLDDLQWAEPRMLDLLETVVSGAGGAPILLLGIARIDLLAARPDWPSVVLEPLSEDHTDTLVGRLADLDPATRSRLVDRAGGSPLFVEELVVAVIEEPDRDLPATIEAVLTARLDRFTRAERQVLELAAIEGLVFHRSAVEHLLEHDEDTALDDTLSDLADAGVVLPESSSIGSDQTYRFRHLLIRDAVYEGIPKRTRARLHERMAAWGAAGNESRVGEYEELLAYHLERAYQCRAEIGVMDDHTRELARAAADRLRATARRAVARADHAASVNQRARAVTLLDCDRPRQLEVLPELGEALRLAGEPHEAEIVLREAMERGTTDGNAMVTMAARVEEALLRLSSDPQVDVDEMTTLAREAITKFETGIDQHRLAKAWALLGDAEWVRCRGAEMDSAFLRSLECLTHTDTPQPPAWVMRLLALGYCTGPMPVDAAIDRCGALLDQAQGSAAAEAAILASIGSLEAMRGDLDRSRALFERCRAIGDELSLGATTLGHLPVLNGQRCTWSYDPGSDLLVEELDAAIRDLRAGCARLEERGQTGVLSTAAAVLARALERRGDVEEADAWAVTSERTAAPDDIASQIFWRGVRARLLTRSGRTDEARVLATDGVALAARTDFLVTHGEALIDLWVVLDAAGESSAASVARAGALEKLNEKGHTLLAAQVLTGTPHIR